MHMDATVTLQVLKDQVKRFCEERDWDQFHSPKDLAIGVVTEAAELLEPFRFKSEQDTRSLLENPKTREHVSEELADVLYFLLRLCQMYGIDLSDAFERKMKRNAEKYPVEKSRGVNKKYTEL